MTKLIAAAAVAAVAGSAFATTQAIEFNMGAWASTNNSGGTVTNTGLFTDGTFYQDGFQTAGQGGFAAPNAAFLGLAPSLANDSYVAIADGPVTAADTNYPGVQVDPFWTGTSNSMSGIVFNTQPRVFSGADSRIFLGRFTTVGGTLQGEIAVGSLFEGSAGSNQVDDQTDPFLLAIGGPAVPAPLSAGGFGQNLYQLVVESFDSDQGLVNDLYIEAIPTPGAMGLLGVAGLAAIRRRR